MILFFGPAGSGKSTQAQMLVDNFGWKWLSMGQLLRDTEDAEVHKIQKIGALVPIEKVNQVLDEALLKISPDEKIVLDGYPRQLDQAVWFIDKCKLHGIKIGLAVNFDVHMEELLERMELRGRIDDTPESIAMRIKIYHTEIDPILNLLSKNNIKVVSVDGIGTPEEIHSRVVKELKECKL